MADDRLSGDDWRVEVELDNPDHGLGIGERLRSMDLDDEARERLGEGVVVSRDGPHLFLYADSGPRAEEAERVVRELLEADSLTGTVELTRWHPEEEAWKAAETPLPESDEERKAEAARHEAAERSAAAETGHYDWQVVIELPGLRETHKLGGELAEKELPVKRRFRYLLVGAPTEERARELASEIDSLAPEGSEVHVSANVEDLPRPGFLMLESLKPGPLRDLGL